MTKKYLKIIIKIVLSLLVLFYLFSKINCNDLLVVFSNIRWFYFLVAFFLIFVPWIFLTWRWKLLLRSIELDVPFKKLYGYNLLGNFYSLFLPGKISGDLVKGYRIVNAHSGENKHRIAMSVLFDRILGISALIILGIFAFLVSPASWNLNFNFLLGIILIFGLFFIFLFDNKMSDFVFSRLKNILPEKMRNSSFFQNVFQSINLFRKNKNVLVIGLVISIFAQLFNIFLNYLYALSLGINISFFNFVVIVSLAMLAVILPISFGGLGVRDGIIVFLMGYFMISAEKALAFSLLLFFVTIVFFGISGIILELYFAKQMKGI